MPQSEQMMTAEEVWTKAMQKCSAFKNCNLFISGNVLIIPVCSFPSWMLDEVTNSTVVKGEYPFFLPTSRAFMYLGCEVEVKVVQLPF